MGRKLVFQTSLTTVHSEHLKSDLKMANTMKLPFEGLRVVELDAYLISGRLTGMLFADQGAEVVILSSGKAANSKVTKLTDGDEVCEKRANDMLNRKVQFSSS